MISILFVCLGNICRSPVAEETFRQLLKEEGLIGKIRCDSAGTQGYHTGDLPDARTRKNAESHGLTLSHKARKLSGKDFADFEYIVAMDEANLTAIRSLHNKAVGFLPDADTVFLLREFDPINTDSKKPMFDVPDPYYGSVEDFEQVYQIVKRSNQELLGYLKERHSP